MDGPDHDVYGLLYGIDVTVCCTDGQRPATVLWQLGRRLCIIATSDPRRLFTHVGRVSPLGVRAGLDDDRPDEGHLLEDVHRVGGLGILRHVEEDGPLQRCADDVSIRVKLVDEPRHRGFVVDVVVAGGLEAAEKAERRAAGFPPVEFEVGAQPRQDPDEGLMHRRSRHTRTKVPSWSSARASFISSRVSLWSGASVCRQFMTKARTSATWPEEVPLVLMPLAACFRVAQACICPTAWRASKTATSAESSA